MVLNWHIRNYIFLQIIRNRNNTIYFMTIIADKQTPTGR
jgi:hypothetical protein